MAALAVPPFRRHRWKVIAALLVAAAGWYLARPLWEPFTSERVPAHCRVATPDAPASRSYAIPGGGTGALLAENAQAAVVVSTRVLGAPGTTRVELVRRRGGRVMRTLNFPSDVVDAGFDGDTVYIFNNKLGYFFDTETGTPARNWIESDNYRGVFTSSGALFVQTDITVSAIRGGGRIVWGHTFPMASIVDGCYVA